MNLACLERPINVNAWPGVPRWARAADACRIRLAGFGLLDSACWIQPAGNRTSGLPEQHTTCIHWHQNEECHVHLRRKGAEAAFRAGGLSSGKSECSSLLLFPPRMARMKRLLVLDLVAVAPSPSIVVKKSLSLLRAIGLSAGLVASTTTASQVHAATSGTTTATGTLPVACSVSGATIAMTKHSAKVLMETATNVPYATDSVTTFSLSAPTLQTPSQYGGNAYESILKDGNTVAAKGNDGYIGPAYTAPGAGSGEFAYVVQVTGGMADVDPMPGTYTISSTLTCVGQ